MKLDLILNFVYMKKVLGLLFFLILVQPILLQAQVNLEPHDDYFYYTHDDYFYYTPLEKFINISTVIFFYGSCVAFFILVILLIVNKIKFFRSKNNLEKRTKINKRLNLYSKLLFFLIVSFIFFYSCFLFC